MRDLGGSSEPRPQAQDSIFRRLPLARVAHTIRRRVHEDALRLPSPQHQWLQVDHQGKYMFGGGGGGGGGGG
jgi:hypothetical protein